MVSTAPSPRMVTFLLTTMPASVWMGSVISMMAPPSVLASSIAAWMVVKSQPEAHTVSVAGKGIGVGGMGKGVGGMRVAASVALLTGVSVAGRRVDVGGMGVAVSGVVGVDEAVHPARNARVRIINVLKSPDFISHPPIGSLFDLHLKRADVARSIGGDQRNRSERSPLVGAECAADCRDSVNRRTALEQGMCQGVAAVVGQVS